MRLKHRRKTGAVIDEGNYDSAGGFLDSYHSRRREPAEDRVHGPAAVSILLLLFLDDSVSMNKVKKAMAVLNPEQIPVITCIGTSIYHNKILKQFY